MKKILEAFAYILGLKFLKTIAETYPAFARLIELSIYSGIIYFCAVFLGEITFSTDTFFAALAVPFLAFVAKIKRDLKAKLDSEET